MESNPKDGLSSSNEYKHDAFQPQLEISKKGLPHWQDYVSGDITPQGI